MLGMKAIAITSGKGGVGKSTTATNLAVLMGDHGKRVLLIDSDPQGSTSLAMGIDPHPDVGLAEVLEARAELDAVSTETHGVTVVAPGLNLRATEPRLAGQTAPTERLRAALEPVSRRFDLVIIDTPPNSNVLLLNGLAVARWALLATQAETLSLHRIRGTLDQLTEVRRHNRTLRVIGAVACMVDTRLVHTKDVLRALDDRFGDECPVLARIPRSVRVSESHLTGSPIVRYHPENPASVAYRRLADAILEIIK